MDNDFGVQGIDQSLKLRDGSKVAVIGGGPSGSFFSYFLLDNAERAGISIEVDIYEEKNFDKYGPLGCNHCGGIISESLVQHLAADGINIPKNVLQRGIDSYVMHIEDGFTRIETELREKRIAAIFRGAGPLGTDNDQWKSFDGFLNDITSSKGAKIIHERVTGINFDTSMPVVSTKTQSSHYDLVAGALGLKKSSIKLFEDLNFGYKTPKLTKTHICELHFPRDVLEKCFDSSMHVFLLNIPRLEFAALVPKGDFVTLVLLGKNIDKELVQSFLSTPSVRACLPEDMELKSNCTCQCYPSINVKSAKQPYSDRIVLIGDCATSKLYKNGIGAAYLTAKAAASTAVFQGVSSNDFKRHYWPVCKKINNDNNIGKMIFLLTKILQKFRFAKRGILKMVNNEQANPGKKSMSMVLWDMFTGSAPYTDILLRTLKPQFIARLVAFLTLGLSSKKIKSVDKKVSGTNSLGKVYKNGEIIVNEGEAGDCMYVIQSGTVEILQKRNGKEVFLAKLHKDDFFGEMALFEKEMRSAIVKAKGEAQLLTIDKKTLLGRIGDDPSLAFRIIEKMSHRLRDNNLQISRMKGSDRRNWETRPDKDTPLLK